MSTNEYFLKALYPLFTHFPQKTNDDIKIEYDSVSNFFTVICEFTVAGLARAICWITENHFPVAIQARTVFTSSEIDAFAGAENNFAPVLSRLFETYLSSQKTAHKEALREKDDELSRLMFQNGASDSEDSDTSDSHHNDDEETNSSEEATSQLQKKIDELQAENRSLVFNNHQLMSKTQKQSATIKTMRSQLQLLQEGPDEHDEGYTLRQPTTSNHQHQLQQQSATIQKLKKDNENLRQRLQSASDDTAALGVALDAAELLA